MLDSLYEGHSSDALELVRSLVGDERVVLSSHGDVVPDVLEALSVEGMEGWFDVQKCKKASVWVLHADGNRFDKAIYHPPPG